MTVVGNFKTKNQRNNESLMSRKTGKISFMGRLRETASFHRRLKNTEFISKKIPFPTKRAHVNNLQIRKYKEPCLVEIRNKHTKELVDIEVRK